MSRKRNNNNIINDNETLENDSKITSLNKLQQQDTVKKSNDIYPRDEILPLQLNPNHKYLKIMTWNVNGLTALVTKKLSVLTNLITQSNADILCLQETKIQENLVEDYKNLLDGYNSYWNCSTTKKGYAGTAIFIKKSILLQNSSLVLENALVSSKKQQSKLTSLWKATKPDNVSSSSTKVTNKEKLLDNVNQKNDHNNCGIIQLDKVSYDFEDESKCFDGEGRTITVEFNNFILVACYVPNSGEGLVRLDYRTKQWDPWLQQYINTLSKRKPVVFTGDLNVGHLDLDIHNPDAKHISKQAGLTPEERTSHSNLLETNFQDAFRTLHHDAKGQFTYWSQRTFARPVNKGLRLDYFICSKDMFHNIIPSAEDTKEKKQISSNDSNNKIATNSSIPIIYDCYILHKETIGCSDHCPVMLVLQL